MKLWRGQPDHNYWRRPFNSREKAGVFLGLAGMCLTLALSELNSPSLPPFTGRYDWFHSLLYQLNSEFGIVSFYILTATIFLIIGVSKWFEKQVET